MEVRPLAPVAVLGGRPLAAAQQEAAQVALAARRRVERPRPAVEVGPEQRQVSVERQALVAPREAPAETEAMQPAQPPVKRLGPALR